MGGPERAARLRPGAPLRTRGGTPALLDSRPPARRFAAARRPEVAPAGTWVARVTSSALAAGRPGSPPTCADRLGGKLLRPARRRHRRRSMPIDTRTHAPATSRATNANRPPHAALSHGHQVVSGNTPAAACGRTRAPALFRRDFGEAERAARAHQLRPGIESFTWLMIRFMVVMVFGGVSSSSASPSTTGPMPCSSRSRWPWGSTPNDAADDS